MSCCPDSSPRRPLTQCRVIDSGGHDVRPGGIGELVLRGETIMKGYWNKPGETAEALRDGWLHTGDLARVDADGYITLADRLKDMIISGGLNVYSAEVENVLAAHPHIADGQPDEHQIQHPHHHEPAILPAQRPSRPENSQASYLCPVLGTPQPTSQGNIQPDESWASVRRALSPRQRLDDDRPVRGCQPAEVTGIGGLHDASARLDRNSDRMRVREER